MKSVTIHMEQKRIEKLSRNEVCSLAAKQYREEHGKYSFYIQGPVTNAIYILGTSVISKAVRLPNQDPVTIDTRVVFDRILSLDKSEEEELVGMLKEEPVEDLILIRSKQPVLAAVVDPILKGVS